MLLLLAVLIFFQPPDDSEIRSEHFFYIGIYTEHDFSFLTDDRKAKNTGIMAVGNMQNVPFNPCRL